MRPVVFAAASAIALACAALPAAAASTSTPSAPSAASAPSARREDPDVLARWFYAVLSGEIAARTGQPGLAYAQLLQAARDMDSAQLYQRAAGVALGAGVPQRALDAIDAWREAQPDNVEAQDWAAQLLIALGRPADAAVAIGRMLALTPAPQRGDMLLQVTQLFGSMPPATAVELARQTLRPYAALPQSHVVVGALLDRSGDREGAFAEAAQALDADPGTAGAALLVVRNYTVDAARADTLLSRYVSARPTDIDIRLAWIQAALDSARNGVALRQAQALTDADPEQAEAWLVRGSLQLDNGDAGDARHALRTYLRLLQRDPRTAPERLARAYLALAEAASKAGDQATALSWLRQVQAGIDDVAVRTQRAFVYARLGRMAQAQALLRAMPAKTAAQRRARLLARADLDLQFGRAGEAWRILRAALPRYRGDAAFTYQAAMAAGRSGDDAAMRALLRGLVATHPDYQPGLNALGYTLADEGHDLAQARQLIERALKLAPGNPFVIDSLGWVDFRAGKLERAEQLLEQAWSARPDPEIGAHLGEVLWQRGEQQRARALLLQVHAQAPHDKMIEAALKRLGIRADAR